MAIQNWYVLNIRTGFKAVAVHGLQKTGIEVAVVQNPVDFQEVHLRNSAGRDYLYCRFGLEDRKTVTSISGVIGILGQIKKPPTNDATCIIHEHVLLSI